MSISRNPDYSICFALVQAICGAALAFLLVTLVLLLGKSNPPTAGATKQPSTKEEKTQ